MKEITFFPRRVLHAFEFVKQITELMPTNPTTHIHTHEKWCVGKSRRKTNSHTLTFWLSKRMAKTRPKIKERNIGTFTLERRHVIIGRKKPRTRKKSVRFYLREDEKRNANIETMYFVDCK